MSLNYVDIQLNLQAVKAEIDELLSYMESNRSEEDRRFIDIEIYTRLANISASVLQSDCKLLKE
jgi:hypothetical protein